MNLRPPSVTVSTHTSTFNAVAFQSPTMPNARMSLWTQSVHSFSFPPVLSVLHPQGFRKRFASAAARRSFGGASPPPKSSRSQRRLNAPTPGYLKGTVVRSHPMVWTLALCPDDTKQDSAVYGMEFGVVYNSRRRRDRFFCLIRCISLYYYRSCRLLTI